MVSRGTATLRVLPAFGFIYNEAGTEWKTDI
jgi:hypothetical protein